MSLSAERTKQLTEQCTGFRRDLISQLHAIQTGHPGGSLSSCEIITVLYQEMMNIDPANPFMEGRDYFILSKGHAAPMLYINMAEKGFFPKEDLKTLRQINSKLQGHPCAHKVDGIELSTGPLGLGLGAGVGMALAETLKGNDNWVYVLLGDGETNEGVIWEAAMIASKFKTDNLIAILDNNGVQLDGTTEEIMPLGDVTAKWQSFGWRTIACDGHDVASFANAVEQAKEKTGKPTMIIAKTVKGKGVSYMEGQSAWHGKPIDEKSFAIAMEELGGTK